MLHTVYIDDTTLNGKKLLQELRRHKESVRFENEISEIDVQEEYLTSEDFWKEADKRIVQVCEHYGIL